MQKEYDVALSFAGEDRQHAKQLADLLESDGYRCFYDEYNQADLWGKNLLEYLSTVYKDKAHYCVVFLSESYAEKLWPRHELRNAAARAFEESGEYILPVRLDDTEISEILPTVGCLDLREMSIDDVYQALAQKLSGTGVPKPTAERTTASFQDDPDEFQDYPDDYVMIGSGEEDQYFIPFQEAQWTSTEIQLELLPESTEEVAFLRSLRDGPNRRFASHVLGFALQDDAVWVSPQSVTQSVSGSQTIWKVVLKIVGDEQHANYLPEMTIGHVSSDQIAELRARRILLDEELSVDSPSNYPFPYGSQSMLESSVRGGGRSQYGAEISVLESPIPELYWQFEESPQIFLKCARLASVFYLKLTRTVEEIHELEFKILRPEELRVSFEGHRHRSSSQHDPYIIQIEGNCPLSE